MKGRAGSALNLIAALAVVFAGLAVPAGATVPGTNGKIAFTSTVPAFNEEIFIVNPAVSGYSETNLTNHPDDDTQPAWSPDGQKIAFISNRDLYPLDQYPDLWIMNGDGSGLLKLTPDASGVSRVEWFPDGSRILFYASCGDSHPLCGWFTVSPEGGDITPFAACAATPASQCLGSQVTWSPYGEPLAYATYTDTGIPTIHTVNPDGTGHGVLLSGRGPENSLDWDVDGGRILFDWFGSGGALKTLEWPSGQVRTLPGSGDFDSWPTWSPDGTRIAFVSQSGQVTTMRKDGTDRRALSSGGNYADPDWQTHDPQPVPQGYARPKAAHELKTFVVPAYLECRPPRPNRTHGPPLDHPSCSPPVMFSQYLTMGTPDSNGGPARFLGWVGFRTLRGNPATPEDESDVEIQTSLTDVRCRHNVIEDPETEGYPCRTGAMSDYTGEVQVLATVGITDKPLSGPRTGTAQSMTLHVNVPCTSTADELEGSTCAISTTMDSLIPGAVVEGARSVWSLPRVEVLDTGVDGDADTQGDNALFAVPGIFVP